MTSKHTATPWHTNASDRNRIRAADDDIVAETWGAMSEHRRQSNAAFIVRACNAYAELRALAQSLADAGSMEDISDAMQHARKLVRRL